MSIKKIKERALTVISKRLDGWQNLISGLGDPNRDRRLSANLLPDLYTQEQGEVFWRADDFGARIVEAVPNEMTREGYRIVTDGESDVPRDLTSLLEDLEHLTHICKAEEYSRAYGGGAVLLGANDGQADWGRPLNENRIRSLDFLTVLSPRELKPVVWYEDIRQKGYGYPKIYELLPDATAGIIGAGRQFVHESRVLHFAGARQNYRNVRTSTTQYGDSVFTRVGHVIRDFQASFAGSFALLGDFGQGTLKIKGLAEMVGSSDPDDQNSFKARIAAFDYARSVIRTAVLDSEEDFERKATPLSGLADILDKFMLRIAAAADMPVSLLMGQSPAGMNSTGAADIRFFYDRVRALQRKRLLGHLKKLLRVGMRSLGQAEPSGWSIVFNPLWQLTGPEDAAMRFSNAQADQVYFNMGALAASEVRDSRFGGDVYGVEIHLDDDTQALLDSPDKTPDGDPKLVHTARLATDPPADPPADPKAEPADDTEPGTDK